ncbi:MAG: hypothetical protein PHQ75_11830, partial [Thermoguttaceae bacterium]|nr:hypothetical protein [Thermoguttaceae bacterium]
GTLAVSLVWLATLRLDAANCVLFDGSVTEATEFGTGRRAAFLAARRLEEPIARCDDLTVREENVSLAEPFRYVGAHLARGGLVAMISDLFVDTQSLYHGIEQLRRQGHEVVVFHLLDDDELDFPFEERSRFEGLESGRLLRCDPRTVRMCYRDLIEQSVTQLKQNCLRRNAKYCLVRTSQPLDVALASFFAERGKGSD